MIYAELNAQTLVDRNIETIVVELQVPNIHLLPYKKCVIRKSYFS